LKTEPNNAPSTSENTEEKESEIAIGGEDDKNFEPS
jgi:hypothetical protein